MTLGRDLVHFDKYLDLTLSVGFPDLRLQGALHKFTPRQIVPKWCYFTKPQRPQGATLRPYSVA